MRAFDTTPEWTMAAPRRRAAWAAWLAAFGFVALSVAAPAPSPLAQPTFEAIWVARVFPGVPPAWVWLRLTALLTCIVASWMATAGTWKDAVRTPLTLRNGNRSTIRWLLAWTTLQATIAIFCLPMRRSLEVAYVIGLAVPPLVLWLRERSKKGVRRDAFRPSRSSLVVGAIVVGWMGFRLGWAENSYRVPTGTDYAIAFAQLQKTLEADYSILSGTLNPGFTALLSVLQGPALFGLRPSELQLWHMQGVQILWAAATALLLAHWSARALGVWSAPVVAAAFLASTATNITTIFVGALFVGPLLAATLALLWQHLDRTDDSWAIVACAATAGSCFTHPSLYLVGALALAALAWRYGRGSDRRHLVWVVAGMSFVSVVAPGIAVLGTVPNLGGVYFQSKQMWAGMQAAAFGLIPPTMLEFHVQTGRTTLFELVTGMLLAPWMTPRTAIRATGDGWFDPIGAALCALGAGAVVGNLHRSRGAQVVGLMLAVTLIPGFISGYDRPSLTRALALPAALAVLAGLGYAWCLAAASPRKAASWSVLLATASLMYGGVIFDRLNPMLLPASALSTVIEGVDAESPCRASWVVSPENDVLFDRLFARQVPRCPLRVVTPSALTALLASRSGEVLYWRPNLEDELGLRERVCRREPQARLFVLWDRPRLVPAFAAALGDPNWRPALPADRWEEADCVADLPTEAYRARRVRAAAVSLPRDAAIAHMRQVAQGTFVQPELYLDLARALIERNASENDAVEAQRWSEYALAVQRWRAPDAVRVYRDAAMLVGDASSHRDLAVLAERTIRELRLAERDGDATALEDELKSLGLDFP